MLDSSFAAHGLLAAFAPLSDAATDANDLGMCAIIPAELDLGPVFRATQKEMGSSNVLFGCLRYGWAGSAEHRPLVEPIWHVQADFFLGDLTTRYAIHHRKDGGACKVVQ